MKKIVILNGAGKRNGATASLIKSFSEGAISSGNEVKEFYLQDMNIHGCLDCQGCTRKPVGDIHPCVQSDDMNLIYEALKDADIMVFASPVYWFSVTGTLKTAVDRLYALQQSSGVSFSKQTIFLMTSGAPAQYNPLATEWYDMFEKMLGWKSIGKILGADKTEEARSLGASII